MKKITITLSVVAIIYIPISILCIYITTKVIAVCIFIEESLNKLGFKFEKVKK